MAPELNACDVQQTGIYFLVYYVIYMEFNWSQYLAFSNLHITPCIMYTGTIGLHKLYNLNQQNAPFLN